MLPVVAFIGLVAVVAAALSHVHFDVVDHRKHLDPIAIAAGACPYVRVMHAAANNLQIAEPIFGTAFDAHGAPLTWPQTRVQLDGALRAMELSVVVGEPKFPAPVQQQLKVVLSTVRQGRTQLASARDGIDFNQRSGPLLRQGQLAFGYAGDLIGNRCGVPLHADTTTMLYPFMKSTPTRDVSVEVELDSTVVTTGDDLAGTAVFTNNTDSTITLIGRHNCALKWMVAVGHSDQRPEVGWRASCDAPSSRTVFRPGTTRIRFRALTRELTGSYGPRPLPVGPAHVWFVVDEPSNLISTPSPIAITLTPPAPHS